MDNHTQWMNEAWRLIGEFGITEDEAEYEADPDHAYLVKDIYAVRDAIYSDLETGLTNDEDLNGFFTRHGIEYK